MQVTLLLLFLSSTVILAELALDTRQHDWQPLEKIAAKVPAHYLYWLNLPGSLTKALKTRSDDFNVEVISESFINDSLQFNGFEQATSQRWFSRMVLLKSGQITWVAAHTLVPQSSLNGGLNQLTELNNKPLGELLFSSSEVIKDHQQICQTNSGWGRRARYQLHQQPLLVSEYFLPELIDYEQKRTASLL